MNAISRFFRLAEHQTNVRTELLAGVTIFLTMAYIIFLQPSVLATDFAGNPTGMDPAAVLLATCLASAIATAVMALLARYPIALAPGMGENFFFVTVVMSLASLGFADAWKTALAIVFISGAAFIILSLFRVREAVIDGISPSMTSGIAAGIGLFITFIGLQKAGIIVDKPGTLVGLNPDVLTADMAVFAFGLLVIVLLQVRRVRGSILIGILGAAILAVCLGKVQYKGVFGLPQVERSAIFQMDFARALSLTCIPFIIVFLFMDLFDTVGTLVGVSKQAGLLRDGKLPRASQALLSDAIGTVVGASLGTSTVTSYIESAAGVEQGGRTGLTALTAAALFLLALFFSPLVSMVGQYAPITAPALVIVGSLMMRNVAHVDWDDASEAIPSFLVIVGIPLCFAISDGLALGFITYPLVKLLGGRAREVKWPMYLIGAALILYFIFVRARL